MTRLSFALRTGLAALALATALPAAAHPPIDFGGSAEAEAAYKADRTDILAMAGDFKVRFDMQETTPWTADYTPLDRKISGGHESVRVIEDTGRAIVLQHLLVVEMDGKSHVIKHWRQDWHYEPAKLLVYTGPGSWTWEDVPERMRSGRWSQTVYQVDDSPRYAGWGQFESQGGVRRWRSNWTWRPLARRDAIRSPVYDRYLAINRHQTTPGGWVHWQDNTKMAGPDKPVVQESVLNTYTRFDGYDVKAADAYWAATKGYWAAVRAEWDRMAAPAGIRVQEEAQSGTAISAQLLEIAGALHEGKSQEPKAIADARALMARHVSAPAAAKTAAR